MSHTRSSKTIADVLQLVFNLPDIALRGTRPTLQRSASSKLSVPRSRYASSFSRRAIKDTRTRPARPPPQPQPPEIPFKQTEVDITQFGPPRQGPLRDEQIKAYRAYLRQPDGTLSEPLELKTILQMRQKNETGGMSQFVQEVVAATGDRPYPIVALKDHKDAIEAERARKQAAKEQKKGEKSIEMSWSVGGNDLDHKLRRLQDFLAKGAKVEVLVGSHRLKGWGHKKAVTRDERQLLTERIQKAAMEVQGTREQAVPSGRVLNQMTLAFQGPLKKDRASKPPELEED